MNVDEAERLGIALEIPNGDCPRCKALRYECGTRRSVRSAHGKVTFPSSLCWQRSEAQALDIIQGWNLDPKEYAVAQMRENGWKRYNGKHKTSERAGMGVVRSLNAWIRNQSEYWVSPEGEITHWSESGYSRHNH